MRTTELGPVEPSDLGSMVRDEQVDAAAGFALGRGAQTLYVSATCSARTVAVYTHFGAVPADPPEPFWLEREPEDVHLVIRLPLRPRRSEPVLARRASEAGPDRTHSGARRGTVV